MYKMPIINSDEECFELFKSIDDGSKISDQEFVVSVSTKCHRPFDSDKKKTSVNKYLLLVFLC